LPELRKQSHDTRNHALKASTAAFPPPQVQLIDTKIHVCTWWLHVMGKNGSRSSVAQVAVRLHGLVITGQGMPLLL
jgi:hypothetical protein